MAAAQAETGRKLSYNRVVSHAETHACGYRIKNRRGKLRGTMGSLRGNGSGSSIDFHDFREYQPGDDLRRVDWNAYARSNMLMVRLFEEDISPVVEICLDASGSMGCWSGKACAAVWLASFISTVARQSEGRPVLLCNGARHSGSDVEPSLTWLSFTSSDNVDDLPEALFSPARTLRFVISDFLFPHDARQMLRRFSRNAGILVPVLVHCAEELHPSLAGGVRLTDAEDLRQAKELWVNKAAVSRYRARLEAHLAAIREYATRFGATCVELRVPDLCDTAVDEDIARIGEIVSAELVRSQIMEIA